MLSNNNTNNNNIYIVCFVYVPNMLPSRWSGTYFVSAWPRPDANQNIASGDSNLDQTHNGMFTGLQDNEVM